ncbi:MAG: hypothetical protein AAFO29_08090 [Actinomycetota bacterium]
MTERVGPKSPTSLCGRLAGSVLLALAVAMVAGGCGDEGDGRDAAGGRSTTEPTAAAAVTTSSTVEQTTRQTFDFPAPSPGRDGPIVHHVTEPSPVGYLALIDGRLSIDAGGCLRVAGRGVVWPRDTRWDDSTNEIVLGDGQRVALGDEVRGAGGYADSSIVQELGVSSLEHQLGPVVAAHVQACFGTGEVAVVNNHPGAIGPAEAEPPEAYPGAVPNHESG